MAIWPADCEHILHLSCSSQYKLFYLKQAPRKVNFRNSEP
uniref:Uncharacterized protein n=1 Tax=Rhizophora mucronata TaxID=61149 RepID=A0A2P2Q8Q2_RHIMU